MRNNFYIPQDPVVIGKTPDGQPVWMEPKDLIPTPDEELERVHNTKRDRESQVIVKLAEAVIENAGRFVEQTFLKTASKSGCDAYFQDQKKAFEMAVEAGYESIQDGLTTVVKCKGKVLRTMTAQVNPRLADAVAKKVMEMVRKLPSNT